MVDELHIQGDLDGLCGQYAIANAAGLCGASDQKVLFQTACRTLARSRWPNVLWEGTTFGDLRRMIAACKPLMPGIAVSYPFHREPPRTNRGFWRRFDVTFADERAACAIIMTTHPSDHWVVAFRDGKRIGFANSSLLGRLRVNRGSLYAGTNCADPRKTVIAPAALALFSFIE